MLFEHSNWLSLVLNSIYSSHTELLFHRLSCTISPLLQKCSLSVFSLTMVFLFVVARHSCNICISLVVTIIFAVFACIITFFIKTYLLWTFCDNVIFISTSKEFPRRTFHLSIGWNINRVSFFLFLSYPFETFLCILINTSTKCALCLKNMWSFNIPIKTFNVLRTFKLIESSPKLNLF